MGKQASCYLDQFVDKSEKAFTVPFDDRIELQALLCFKKIGKLDRKKIQEPGFLDVIGRKRISRWEALNDLSEDEVKSRFINHIYRLCPLFLSFLEAYARNKGSAHSNPEPDQNIDQHLKSANPAVVPKKFFILHNEHEIRQALNELTSAQFQSYAQHHFPSDSIKERHFREYMNYVQNNCDFFQTNGGSSELISNSNHHHHQPTNEINNSTDQHVPTSCSSSSPSSSSNFTSNVQSTSVVATNTTTVSSPLDSRIAESDSCECNGDPIASCTSLIVHAPALWTRNEVNEFKQFLADDEQSVIHISSGEVFSVKVQTHSAGKSIVWEFATDNHDIGFGLYFEWPNVESEDSEEKLKSDGGNSSSQLIDEIVPTCRRDSHLEVCCGSHLYPGVGTYLFKFDNSFSLWRSKTLYYRVYYTS